MSYSLIDVADTINRNSLNCVELTSHDWLTFVTDVTDPGLCVLIAVLIKFDMSCPCPAVIAIIVVVKTTPIEKERIKKSKF